VNKFGETISKLRYFLKNKNLKHLVMFLLLSPLGFATIDSTAQFILENKGF
jgi:hypothetical protein